MSAENAASDTAAASEERTRDFISVSFWGNYTEPVEFYRTTIVTPSGRPLTARSAPSPVMNWQFSAE
jgi:hypothetical protein